jgi:hypothetical protein
MLGSEWEASNAFIPAIHGPYFHDVSIAKCMRCGESRGRQFQRYFCGFEYIIDVLLFGIGK